MDDDDQIEFIWDELLEVRQNPSTSSAQIPASLEQNIVAPPLPGPFPTPQIEPVGVSKTFENSAKLTAQELLDKIDEENNCLICTEPYSNEDKHHLTALKNCGHLYGKSCIEQWLKARENQFCPSCRKKATKKDIIKIFSRCVRPMDDSDRIALSTKITELKQENNTLNIKVSKFQYENQELKLEVERLRVDVMKSSQSARPRRVFAPPGGAAGRAVELIQLNNSPKFSVEFLKDLEINEPGAKIHQFYSIQEALIVTCQSRPSTLFPSTKHGFRKIWLDRNQGENIFIHDERVKDMYIDQFQNSILTVSQDKTLKISSLISKTVLSTLTLDSEAWSVSMNPSQQPDYIYLGMRNGDICLYDRRKLESQPFERISSMNKTPMISIQNLEGYQSGGQTIMMCVQMNGGYLYIKDADREESDLSFYEYLKLPWDGKFSNVSYDRKSNRTMISFRPSPRHLTSTHYVFDYVNKKFTEPHLLTRLSGSSKNDVHLSRSKIFSHPTLNDCVIAASYDQDSRGVNFWDTDTQDCKLMRVIEPVRDIDFIDIPNRALVSCLTENVVKLYGIR